VAHPRDRRRPAAAARRGHGSRTVRVPHGEEPRREGHRGPQRGPAHQLATDLIGRSGARGLPPRTEALLDELLPTWRDAIAAVG
jgi:hypothetical protein